jgi:hypothetical protein
MDEPAMNDLVEALKDLLHTMDNLAAISQFKGLDGREARNRLSESLEAYKKRFANLPISYEQRNELSALLDNLSGTLISVSRVN